MRQSSDPRTVALQKIKASWADAWQDALRDWSPFVQLHEPTWCFTEDDEKRAGLTGSFAMIRLTDHSVVISVRQVQERGLEDYAPEILAHEIGHHVYCPADLTDNARLLARIRRGLPGVEAYAPYLANIYADILLNDRLQRTNGRRIHEVYEKLLPQENSSNLWQLIMRTYEVLWNLPPQTLSRETLAPRVEQDAVLAARLIRAYSKDWLGGAGRFACLCLTYITEDMEGSRTGNRIWCDTLHAGEGGVPDGLTELDEDEETGAIHPSEDPALSGLDPLDLGELGSSGTGRVPSQDSGRKTLKSYRDPVDYAELLKASGVTLDNRQIAARYYRERAIPYLIPFPTSNNPTATDPLPEGIDQWDPANDIDRVDWVSTLTTSPVVIPGVTTRERLYGASPGNDPERVPFDLYLGIDCSGSMRDPALTLSYPVLSGTIISLSALRAGAGVQVVLSGEPGQSVSTDGFLRNQKDVLSFMVQYLGTGYSFGIHRLGETFGADYVSKRPVHILIVSDYDMFAMLDTTDKRKLGWIVAKEAVERCRGGATYVLQLPGYSNTQGRGYSEKIDRMRSDGWNVHVINSMEELLVFAKQFSRAYDRTRNPSRSAAT